METNTAWQQISRTNAMARIRRGMADRAKSEAQSKQTKTSRRVAALAADAANRADEAVEAAWVAYDKALYALLGPSNQSWADWDAAVSAEVSRAKALLATRAAQIAQAEWDREQQAGESVGHIGEGRCEALGVKNHERTGD